MYISPSSCLFFSTLIGGVILSVTSDSWFGAWCGLELNLMSFIPFISNKINQYSSEASLKYFLIQALGSAFIILGAISIFYYSFFIYMMCLALLLKIGAAPFHFWFPQVMEGLTWMQSALLMTIQKIAPMYLLSYTILIKSNLIVFWSAILSAIIGSIGGINQTFLRKLLAFSSINHMSWMLFAMFLNEKSWLMYFAFYSFISFSVILMFHYQQSFHFSQLLNFNKPTLSLVSFLSLLSMGGLPPFTGFIPKWFIIQEMIFQKLFFPFLILLISALITLYYYLRVTITFLNILSPKVKWNMKHYLLANNVPLLLMLNFLGLLFPSIFILI